MTDSEWSVWAALRYIAAGVANLQAATMFPPIHDYCIAGYNIDVRQARYWLADAQAVSA